jgi:hypothetical protein
VNRVGDWMQTFTGHAFWPLDPRVEDVFVEDIAHHLSNVCRYAGAARSFFSVAEHSILVSQHVALEYALEALLHDASEAYLGDVIRPLKRSALFASYLDTEARLTAVIFERFGVASTEESHLAIKEVDDRTILDEAAQVMAPPPRPWNERGTPLGVRISCHSPDFAEWLFLKRFRELAAQAWGSIGGPT